MVFNGKVLFVLSTLLPETQKHILFNYSSEELEWCEKNEKEVWSHFINMELLFTDKNFQIRKYMGDAPFIPGFPEGSPGRVGQWMGFNIVSAFMKQNSNMSLEELMKVTDSNKILQESRYKPGI